MVVRAQQGKVVQARFAPVQPVLDVVAVQESVVGAPGEGATAVAQEEGAANGRRNGAGAPAD